MLGVQFQDQAKRFADALLASRTATILHKASEQGKIELSSDDIRVVEKSVDMLSSGLAGLEAAEGRAETSEMGFLVWMENLRHYGAAFDAVIRNESPKKAKDVTKPLTSAKEGLEQVLKGTMPKQLEGIIIFLSSISDVNLDVALDSIELPPQELRAPEEVSQT